MWCSTLGSCHYLKPWLSPMHGLPPHPSRIPACWQVVQSYSSFKEGAETWTGEGAVCQGLLCPWRRTGHRERRGRCGRRCLGYLPSQSHINWFFLLHFSAHKMCMMHGVHVVHTHRHVHMTTHTDWPYDFVHVSYAHRYCWRCLDRLCTMSSARGWDNSSFVKSLFSEIVCMK